MNLASARRGRRRPGSTALWRWRWRWRRRWRWQRGVVRGHGMLTRSLTHIGGGSKADVSVTVGRSAATVYCGSPDDVLGGGGTAPGRGGPTQVGQQSGGVQWSQQSAAKIGHDGRMLRLRSVVNYVGRCHSNGWLRSKNPPPSLHRECQDMRKRRLQTTLLHDVADIQASKDQYYFN